MNTVKKLAKEVLIEVGQVYRKVDPKMWFEGVDCITISHQDSVGRWCESTDTHIILSDDVRNGVFELVEEVNKEHQYEPLVSEGLVSFCTDTGSVVDIVSEEEVWVEWRGLKWNISGWSDKKFNELTKKIKRLEESSLSLLEMSKNNSYGTKITMENHNETD